MLRTTEPLQLLKTQDPDRYFRLETFLNRKIHDAQELYAYGLNKERRRQEIADSLAVEVSVVPPSRLLALLQQALRYQQLQGNLPKDRRYDLFRGSARSAGKDEAERPPKKQVLTCFFSSPCGRYPDLSDFFWKTPSLVPLPRPLPRSSCILRFPFLFFPLPPPLFPNFPPQIVFLNRRAKSNSDPKHTQSARVSPLMACSSSRVLWMALWKCGTRTPAGFGRTCPTKPGKN